MGHDVASGVSFNSSDGCEPKHQDMPPREMSKKQNHPALDKGLIKNPGPNWGLLLDTCRKALSYKASERAVKPTIVFHVTS